VLGSVLSLILLTFADSHSIWLSVVAPFDDDLLGFFLHVFFRLSSNLSLFTTFLGLLLC